jgi:hypothetical protein
LKVSNDYREARRARDRLLQAEQEAFRTVPEALVSKTGELVASQEQLEQRTKQIAELVDRAQASLQVGVLFDLYSKQIEKYQTETQARAGWSFIFAILAMFAGLGFVIWGGSVIFTSGDWQKVAAGSAISAIGGAVSAYITKTFLDVHRLSLLQLNRYFRQPVLNAYVLTAQRLADQVDEPEAKRMAYAEIIARVVGLTREDVDSGVPASMQLNSTSATTRRKPRKSRRKTQSVSNQGVQATAVPLHSTAAPDA